MTDEREIVLSILMDIETNDTFSNIAIGNALSKNQFIEKNERAFITRLSEGVIETKIKLDYIINQFSKTKINKCKPLIRCVLRMGLYQILYMNSVPASAACNEAVKITKKHGFASLSGFVNGVLRNISRNIETIKLPASADKALYLSVNYSIPQWLVEKIMKDYPDNYESIIAGTFAERKTSIRVNTTKISVNELAQKLKDAGVDVQQSEYSDKALLISEYDFIKKIPGYKQGFFTVQDESSICMIDEAGIKASDKIADFCAAPGGKTTACLEYLNNTGSVLSMDISEDKLSLIEDNIERLGFTNAKVCCHDATKKLENNEQFDIVITDVPCSGLGIIGRKNDIKYRISPNQIEDLIALQKQIMSNASTYVKAGGTYIYSTCTINPDENASNVNAFLDSNPDFVLEKSRQFVPGVDSCDGFYYAIMKKKCD